MQELIRTTLLVRWHTLAEKHQSLIDQNPEYPSVKLAFMFKALRITRSYAPTTSYGFFRTFRTAKNTTCNRVQHPVATPEPGSKSHLMPIEPNSFGEVRSRVIIEIGIGFTVYHAERLALVA
jgi:hypothetical protein